MAGRCVPVTWSILDPRIGALSAATGVSTDVRALAVGSTTVRATAGGVSGSAQFTATQPLPAARLEKVSGDGATCPTYSFGCTFVVRTLDANGEPVSGASVQWSSGGCGGFAITTSDEDGLAARSNLCSEAPPGTYSQSATLLVNQQQVTFAYSLRGVSLFLQYADSESALLSVLSSTTTAGGLSAEVKYRAGPVSNYVSLELGGTTTPTALTVFYDLYSLPIGTYVFDVIVATTTPGLGPGIETFSFTLCDCSSAQPVRQLRRVVRSAVPSSSTPEPRP
jgi:hypothetical protein